MGRCETCNDLQVDSATNLTTEETSRPESYRLHSFSLSSSIESWYRSAQDGCATCRLIWDALVRFDRNSVLDKLLQISTSSEPASSLSDDGSLYLELSGVLGQTLLMEFVDLPSEIYFPSLELFSLGSRDTLPTRVLDIGDGAAASQVRLHETAPGQCGEYVALSYCWGQVGNLKTTKETLKQRKSSIPWELMPRSFEEAIEITRGLEMRYLWIDSLCIIQDDASDWKRESARMAEVYENASLTISIDGALDPTSGILTPRRFDLVSTTDTIRATPVPTHCRSAAVEAFSITSRPENIAETVYAREPIHHEDITLPRSHYDITYPLLTRAWTLQERLLSQRILHATASELIWECKTTLFCECGTISRSLEYLDGGSPKVNYDRAMLKIIEESKRSLSSSARQQNGQQKTPQFPDTSRAWTLLIGDYSNRMLTYDSDKLPAVSALARRFSLVDELPAARCYLAGLWLEDLPWLLCWRVYGRRFEKRPDVYCGPSWSWVSLLTPVIWDMRVYEAQSVVEVVRATAVPEGAENPFGRITGAQAAVKGRLQKARVCFDVEHDAVLGLRNERGEKVFFVPDQSPLGPESNETPPESSPASFLHGAAMQRGAYSLHDGEEVFCLWVLHHLVGDDVYGLVLAAPVKESIMRSVPQAPPSSSANVFERVGVITAMSRRYQKNETPMPSWFSGAEVQTITII
ncbi:HET-domain-containing protein [Hypoxylon sp. FL1284]|nr:HET-domain-containing protein [Hypoxylon sp. FL1284]